MVKISLYEVDDLEKEHLKRGLKKNSCKFYSEHLNSDNVDKNSDAIVIFIYSKISKEFLDRMPKLKLICTMSTGFDHIDVKECAKRNITVCNVPKYGENTVAEHVFALLLSLIRKIVLSSENTRKGIFDISKLRGSELQGKTIGLLGTGNISSNVARIANGFEMKILGYDLRQNPELEKKYGLKYVSLNAILKESDIVSLHLPLLDSTKHIIDKKRIKLMKDGVILINTARGGLVNTYALAEALQTGKIAYAGLDVLEEEGFIKEEKVLLSKEFLKTSELRTALGNNILLRMDNVLITPHNAFNSHESLLRIINSTIENVNSYYAKNPKNIVRLQ